MEMKIISGKDGKLKEEEKIILDRIFEEYSGRIERQMKGIESLEIYIKEYGKAEIKKKFSVHIKVVGPLFFESSADDWDFSKTLNSAFIRLMNEIEHRLHISNQRGNFRKIQKIRKRD